MNEFKYIKHTDSKKLKDNECCFFIKPGNDFGQFVDKNNVPVTGKLINDWFINVYCSDGRYTSITNEPLQFKHGKANYWHFGKMLDFNSKEEYNQYVISSKNVTVSKSDDNFLIAMNKLKNLK